MSSILLNGSNMFTIITNIVKFKFTALVSSFCPLCSVHFSLLFAFCWGTTATLSLDGSLGGCSGLSIQQHVLQWNNTEQNWHRKEARGYIQKKQGASYQKTSPGASHRTLLIHPVVSCDNLHEVVRQGNSRGTQYPRYFLLGIGHLGTLHLEHT